MVFKGKKRGSGGRRVGIAKKRKNGSQLSKNQVAAKARVKKKMQRRMQRAVAAAAKSKSPRTATAHAGVTPSRGEKRSAPQQTPATREKRAERLKRRNTAPDRRKVSSLTPSHRHKRIMIATAYMLMGYPPPCEWEGVDDEGQRCYKTGAIYEIFTKFDRKVSRDTIRTVLQAVHNAALRGDVYDGAVRSHGGQNVLIPIGSPEAQVIAGQALAPPRRPLSHRPTARVPHSPQPPPAHAQTAWRTARAWR